MDPSAAYAVIFVSQRTKDDVDGYSAMAKRMEELVHAQEGFVGMHSVRDASGRGITVAYWTSLEAIRKWRENAEHLHAQQLGRSRWYEGYEIAVGKIERQAHFGTL
jgi:heme-degrading monooxygenase HmoA